MSKKNLKVIIVNPPNKKESKEMIKKISRKLSAIYSLTDIEQQKP